MIVNRVEFNVLFRQVIYIFHRAVLSLCEVLDVIRRYSKYKLHLNIDENLLTYDIIVLQQFVPFLSRIIFTVITALYASNFYMFYCWHICSICSYVG